MDSAAIEAKLLDQYGGRGNALPQTLMFDHISPATRLLEKRRQMFEVFMLFFIWLHFYNLLFDC